MPLPEQLVGVVIQRTPGDQDPLIFDATFESQHMRTAEITSVPIETGADVTDHRRRMPLAYRFRSIFLEEDPNPLTANQRARAANGSGVDQLESARDNGPAPTPTRALDLYEDLLELDANDSVVTVYTDLEVIENAMIENLDSNTIGDSGIEITGAFKVVRFATAELVALPKAEVRTSKKKKNKGTKSAKKNDNPKLKSESFLRAGFRAGRSALGF